MAKTEKIKLTTPAFIGSFPNLFKAKPSGTDGKGKLKYGVTAQFDPRKFTPSDKAKWDALLAAIDKESRKAFQKPWADLKATVFKKGLRLNGDREHPFENIPEDAYFANITSDFKPGVIDINKLDISPEEGNEDAVYPGCLMRATVNIYSFEVDGGKNKGIGIGLNNIQVISSDTAKYPRLDNRKNASEDFDDDLDDHLSEEGDEGGY